MSTTEVLHLDQYRSRRAHRLRTALALGSWRPDRRIRVEAMVKALEITGADRAVTAWVDDLGQGAVCVDHVLDLGADPPRRAVSKEMLELACAHGVPGLGDAHDRARAGVLFFPDQPSSSAVVAVGSDGSRSWFLVVDSITRRGRLTPRQRESLMFLGGELAAVVLDREANRLPVQDSFENARSEAFAGWGVLGDLADGNVSEQERDRVNVRFLIARVLKCHLDEGLAEGRPGFAEQIAQVRAELHGLHDDGSSETVQSLALLDALEMGRVPDVCERVLDQGRSLEEAGHLHAAREFYLSGYEFAVQCQSANLAIDAAWGLGRASRRAADWSGAFRWYGIARDISSTLEIWDRHGRVLDGLANAYRDRGNLPRAREELQAALDVSERTNDSALRSSVLHTFMTVEKLAGDHDLAIVYGWESVQSQDDPERGLWALMDLGAVFLESGRFDAADDAFSIVASAVQDRDARVLALNGRTQVAALRRDRSAFDRGWAAVEAAEWQKASAIIRGQVMFDRGLSWKALGDEERAHEWLELALSFGEAQGVGKLILDAEAAIADVAIADAGDNAGIDRQQNEATPVARDRRVEEVCRGLATMREAVPVIVG